jgi:molybdate transport system substrate-binding protein
MALFSETNIKAQTLTIAVAANLRDAMSEIVIMYKVTNPSCDIAEIYGSSGNITQQIFNNAPFDIFIAADTNFTMKVKEKGLAASNVVPFAIGKLVIWSSKIDVGKGISALKDNTALLIAIANPTLAPYGERAIEVLKFYNCYTGLKPKLVFAENVSQAAQYVLTGNTDVGFISLSEALSTSMKGKGNYFNIDQKSYKLLFQSYVILKRCKNKDEAERFAHFLTGESAQKVFKMYGYEIPPK